ncbi:MAG: DUF5681 domain-containing protein [Myxococcota bacterium]
MDVEKLANNRGSGAGRGGVVPPVESRWRPGESGNPKGRPKGAKTSFEAIFERELSRRVAGDPKLDGNRRISRRTRIVREILDRVEAGDARMVKIVVDRLWPVAEAEAGQTQQPIVIVFDDQDREEFETLQRD